jgi:hypothetical protein
VFAADGKHLFYLVRAQESRVLNAGELWTTDLESSAAQPVLPRIPMSQFDISQDGRSVAFANRDGRGAWHTWLAVLDRSSPARPITNLEASHPCFGPQGQLYFIVHEGSRLFLYVLGAHDGKPRQIYPDAVEDLSGVSPNGEWLLFGNGPPIIARRLPGGLPIRICTFCGIGWGPGDNILYLRFRNVGTIGGGRTVAIELQRGEELPSLSGSGLDSLEDLTHLKVLANIDMKDVAVFAPGPDPQTFAYSRITIQRNLFRIPID